MPYKNMEDRHQQNLTYRREHKERVNELNRIRYNADKDTANARRRELYAEHRDYVSLYRRQLRIDNPDRIRRYHREYQKLHPEQGREKYRRYRTRINNAPGDGITREQETQLFEEYSNHCVYCGSENKLTIDHIVPLSRGGANDIDNAVPACVSCNCSKGMKPLLIWMYATKSGGLDVY